MGADPSLAVAPGRDFAFSRWHDEEFLVVFDGNSGDFWIVSRAACHVLELLQQGAKTRRDIIARISSDPSLSIDDKDSASVVDGLLTQKLIVVAPT